MAQDGDITLYSALVKAASQIVTWLLVVVGWIVVSDQQYHRELIKARREKLDDLRKKLRELEDSARKFHTTTYDQPLMQSILRMSQGISLELSLLRNERVVGLGTIEDMVKLRQSITAGNFDESSHTDAPDASVLASIDEAYRTLDQQLATTASVIQTKRQTIFESLRDIRKRIF